jgi:histidyl-tRNA synthetase
VARRVFRSYNYAEIRTPIFEETALFARGVGEETDIVTKEMYTFEDRDGTSLTLRPENTASVIRAYIEHRLDQVPGLTKLYYIGPMFRRERPQKGRYRQFFQIGAEAIGSPSPQVDAEVIEMVTVVLAECGLKDFHLVINSVGDPESRAAFIAKLREDLEPVKDRLSEDNRRRASTNPLRVLDSKEPQDEEIIATLPSILDFLNEGCREHFATVRRLLDERHIAYEVRPRLVRGLDYYTHTTFEIVHGALGAQNSVMGGGRYNGLAESLGSRVAAPGIGFSIGEDRLVMAVEESGGAPVEAGPEYFVAYLSDEAGPAARTAAHALRAQGRRVEVALEARLKRALELANKVQARRVAIFGYGELAADEFMVKDMASGEQKKTTLEELLNG